MTEAAKWDERYQRPGYWAGAEPEAILREVVPLLPVRGRALELAMGEGRNAVWLAQQGWRVTGVDQAAPGLDKAEALARERGVNTWRASATNPLTAPRQAGVVLFQRDLEETALRPGTFDLVVVVRFMLRSLMPRIAAAVGPRAFLLYETYTTEQLRFEGGPRNREYLLEPGELRETFRSLDVLFYRETNAGKGMATLLARRVS
jgi:SAM-dependent methyltransferase